LCTCLSMYISCISVSVQILRCLRIYACWCVRVCVCMCVPACVCWYPWQQHFNFIYLINRNFLPKKCWIHQVKTWMNVNWMSTLVLWYNYEALVWWIACVRVCECVCMCGVLCCFACTNTGVNVLLIYLYINIFILFVLGYQLFRFHYQYYYNLSVLLYFIVKTVNSIIIIKIIIVLCIFHIK